MIINNINVTALDVPLNKTFKGSYYSMTKRATLITEISTDEGINGIIYNGDEPEEQLEIRNIILNEIFPIIEGLNPLNIEKIWEKCFYLTKDILRNRATVIKAISCVDSALWDIVGKKANMPLRQLWGSYHDELPIIAIGGYYSENLFDLNAEIKDYQKLGISGCKMKIGSSSPEEDAKRFIHMRNIAGEKFILIADANQGYGEQEAIEFCNLVKDYQIDWIEEPIEWIIDRQSLRNIRYKTGIPVAAGQSEISRQGILDLITNESIDICNFDASWGGGPTEWLKVAGLCESNSIHMAHHEEPQISAQLLGSVKKAKYIECFHPDRDPIFWNLIENKKIINGKYQIPNLPGWGITLNNDFVNKYKITV